ncbi:MAG: heat-inducible transcriptional repressor HrcA [Alphaproteobacteria bacterium]|nr:heat-inducible transcriptional repressor HrcA [Alphaproteobacteria bacterium]
MFPELNQRSREILKHVVDAYTATGEPVGSRAVAERLGLSLSPASIRHVMAELEAQGLLHAPHVSAGRVPTDAGLRFFVDGILEIGGLAAEDKKNIEAQCAAQGKNLSDVLARATDTLAGLSSCAGLVLAPKMDRPLRQIEFVNLAPGRVLVILVTEDGLVENRVIEAPLGLDAGTLTMAANYLNRQLAGRPLAEVQKKIEEDMRHRRAELDGLTQKLVAAGLAVWSGQQQGGGQLLIRGQARLLEDVSALADVERIRQLFDALETEEAMTRLLKATEGAEGVQIFIGAENTLFAHAGCSVIVAPYKNTQEQVIGAIGVIGPVRMNYARIIPMVDYTAQVVGKLVG